MTTLHKIALTTLLALALGACGDDADDTSALKADAIAPIAAPAGQSWADVAVETPEGGFRIGNPEAPVKLVEYASHTCPHCADFAAEAGDPIRDKYVASGVVSFELRNQIHDGIDLTIARLVRCSGDPAGAIALAEQAWANLPQIIAPAQANPQVIEQSMRLPEGQRFQALAESMGLVEFFGARGLARDQQMQCLSDFASIKAISDRSAQQSEDLDVTGTPTFFINGRNLGTLDWPELEANLQNAGAR